MDDTELKNLWKSYDQKLEEARLLNIQSWALNLRSFEMMQTQKAKSKIKSLQGLKGIMVFGGIVWTILLVILIIHSLAWHNIFFILSAGMIALFTILAIIVYIRHIVLIQQIDNSENIVETQKKLATLQSSTINTTRILWLQMPFYTTFFFTPEFFTDLKSWLISIPVTLLFTFFSVWLYRNINYENRNRKWFKWLFNGPEWNAVIQAMGFINEIDDYKNNI
jgi:MFS family permease